MMASFTGGSENLPEPRERSRSCSDEQRPQPKPRKRTARFQSVRYTGNRVGPGASASADSSPNLPRETRSRSILQATPLVQALTNQLVSSLNQNAGGNQQEAKTDLTQREDDAKRVVNLVGSKCKSARSPIVQRDRAHSEPRSSNAPPRPPLPTYPPPPNPRLALSRLITQHQAASNGIHVIDSRSKSKTLPLRRSMTSAAKTTKYGTPPPSRPAPPPPKGMEKGKERGKDSPRSQNPPVPTPRVSSLPKPTIADSASTSKVQKNTTNEAVDQSFPVYEDLDKDDNNYEILDPSSSSSEENEPTINTQDDPSASSDAPPPLPPKKGSKIELHKKEEELPPLPPRTLPATTVRKHRVLANHSLCDEVTDKGNDSEEENEDEALQDTGVYEPVIYRDSDDDSQKSQEFYTEMNDPSTPTDSDLENDHPEDIYITMDPHAYIPPPQTYKPKKKRATFKTKQH